MSCILLWYNKKEKYTKYLCLLSQKYFPQFYLIWAPKLVSQYTTAQTDLKYPLRTSVLKNICERLLLSMQILVRINLMSIKKKTKTDSNLHLRKESCANTIQVHVQ